jgi:hypothetical protein
LKFPSGIRIAIDVTAVLIEASDVVLEEVWVLVEVNGLAHKARLLQLVGTADIPISLVLNALENAVTVQHRNFAGFSTVVWQRHVMIMTQSLTKVYMDGVS